jgi:hypothetical protein
MSSYQHWPALSSPVVGTQAASVGSVTGGIVDLTLDPPGSGDGWVQHTPKKKKVKQLQPAAAVNAGTVGNRGRFNAQGSQKVKLYVGNLSYGSTEQKVRQLFEKCADLSRIATCLWMVVLERREAFAL